MLLKLNLIQKIHLQSNIYYFFLNRFCIFGIFGIVIFTIVKSKRENHSNLSIMIFDLASKLLKLLKNCKKLQHPLKHQLLNINMLL